MVFDEYGNFKAGIHKICLPELEESFVSQFPSSSRRREIFDNFKAFFDLPIIKRYNRMFSKIWIDGSFSTNKLNPNDIDGIIFLKLNSVSEDLPTVDEFMQLYRTGLKALGQNYDFDFYLVYDINRIPENDEECSTEYQDFRRGIDYNTKYWMGQFCFDRDQRPKGIFEIEFKEGEFNV